MNGKQLKNSILQWAIQGKLVPQDASEESAIELLKRLNPKIKPITEDVPFEVPESWVWTSIKDIGNIVTGSTPPKANKEHYEGNIPFFKPTDLEQGRNVCFSRDHLSQLGFEISRQLPPNSILVTCIGATIGKTGMTSIEGTCNQQINAIIPYKEIFPPYVYYACNSEFFQCKIKDNASATTLPILNKNKFGNLIFPLPPLAEQKRIVAKIEELMPLVERYTKAQEGLDKLNAGVKRKLRASLLQEAIQGKLVPQDANDEPAIELLKRINPKFKPVECEGELPEGWSVATLSTLCTLIDGEKIQGKEMINLDAKYLRGKSGGTILTSGRYIPSNSLVILVDGENSGEVFRTPVEGYQGSTFKHLTINENMFDDFVLWVINSHRVKLREHKVGSAIPHLNKKLFRETLVLVPPLAEQKRIVAKIEALFGVLGRL